MKGRQPVHIHWDAVMFALELGNRLGDIARDYGITVKQFGQRAKRELPADVYPRYRRLVLENRCGHPVVCGTQGGYEKHRREKQKDPAHEICQPCRTAHHEYMKRYKEKRPLPEYKVNFKGRVKRYGREVWVVERHNPTKGIRHIASYTDKEVANEMALYLNNRAEYEVG